MTIIRESRGAPLEALHRRAQGEGGEAFAEQLCNLIEHYRIVRDQDWPEWPTPSNTRAQAERIMRAAGEVLAAYSDAADSVRARLRANLRDAGHDPHAFDTHGAQFAGLGALMEAAATIYQAQPRTGGARKDATRDGFLRMLREHFAAHGVKFTAAASVSEHDGREFTSLAVDAAALALEVRPAAARKAIERAGTLS